MLKQLWSIICLFLILIIFLRMPQENIGLSSFANKTDILGSPSSAQNTLNWITAVAVMIYILLAVVFNLNKLEGII